jgi:replicative DNA helicase
MLIDNAVIPVINDILSYEDFAVFKNKFIYRTISRMYNFGMKVDFLTVTNEISKETDKITLDDISNLINRYLEDIRTENAIFYAKIIKEKASIRKLEVIMDNKKKYLRAKNFVDAVNMIEKDITDVALYGGVKSTNVLTSEQAVTMAKDLARKLFHGEIKQIETGFSLYDKKVGGFYPNELIICAARSGDGKSSLALSIANHVALKQQNGVAFFSLEMSTYESVCRLVCQLTGLPFKQVYRGEFTKDEFVKYEQATDLISKAPIYWDDTFGISIPEIRSKVRKLAEEDVKLIIIDQLEQVKGFEGLQTHIQFDKICYAIHDMAQEFQIPIILNHQLNRSITDRRLKNPTAQLSDLNQAGEKAANQVWVIRHKRGDDNQIIQSKISILKNRNGPQFDFPVQFVGDRMLFTSPVHEEDMVAFSDSEPHVESKGGAPFWSQMD